MKWGGVNFIFEVILRLILVLCVDVCVGSCSWKYRMVAKGLRKTTSTGHGPHMDLIEAAGSYG